MYQSLSVMTATLALMACAQPATGDERDDFDREFRKVVRPFLDTYCASCHGIERPKAGFDISPYTTLESVTDDLGHWRLVLERLDKGDMPPKDTVALLDDGLRRRVAGWVERLRRHEARKNAGDPGPVPARRLSNAEYNYTIHDLTGVDIRPTQDFPVDPANEAGFDNTGESLTMSPALLNKYLAAARHVADHSLLLSDGIEFAPFPVVVYSDRDKFATHRIVEFYESQPTDYADYLFAAWRYRHRQGSEETLQRIAEEEGVSGKYLAGKLDAMPEGEATVLDNSCLMFINNLWSGKAHDSSKAPVILAGGLGGTLRMGRVLDYTDRGTRTESFAACTCQSRTAWGSNSTVSGTRMPGSRGCNQTVDP